MDSNLHYFNLFKKENEQIVVLDLETDGLLCTEEVVDNILSVSALKIRDKTICERFFSYVAQDRPIHEAIVELTGITDDTVKGAPDIKKVLSDLYDFIGDDDCTICSHNVNFDMSFINAHGRKDNFISFYNPTIDTVVIARELLKDKVENYRLNTCCEYFNIPLYMDDVTKIACLVIELAKMKQKA